MRLCWLSADHKSLTLLSCHCARHGWEEQESFHCWYRGGRPQAHGGSPLRPVVLCLRDQRRGVQCTTTVIMSLFFSHFQLSCCRLEIEIKPKRYDSSHDRYQVTLDLHVMREDTSVQLQCSPWSVMRCLAHHFGYVIPVMPIGGQAHMDLQWDSLNTLL